MTTFTLHPQLLADCHSLGRLAHSHLLLHRNAAVPWFILVPETALTNLLDLPARQREGVLADANADPNKAPQPAITQFRRLATVELPYPVSRYPSARYSLVELHPKTGRKHQLRRHLKHIFHPIIGDTSHGDGRHNQFFIRHFANQRLLLAATSLQLHHPHSGDALVIRAPLAADFQRIVAALGWDA
jgi:tRNA pseudouridine65 synthase